MKIKLLKLVAVTGLVAIQSIISLQAQTVSTAETLTLSPNSYWDGSSMPLGTNFTSGNAIFQNYFDTTYPPGYWTKGWAYSNMKDSTTAGSASIYSARTGVGYNGSANYLIGTQGSLVYLNPTAKGKVVNGFYVTNSTYTAISMKDGDSFAKKFGGISGNEADWLKLTVRKWLGGVLANDSVEFYLADYRFTNNTQDYIVKTWQWVNLTSLGNVDSLKFSLSSSDNGSFGMNTPAYFCMDNFTTTNTANIIFAPAAGKLGTTAVHKDSAVVVSWATGCEITRGYQDISNHSLGYATTGDSSMALGIAGSNGIVSLGDGGSAILTFATAVKNGAGPDFAVFENGFNDTFLELAFVEVSSDGTNFFRFPATSNTQNSVQLGNDAVMDPTKINNLAGKYKGLYGTPFDLDELIGQNGLDVNNITHVKIIDVVGSLQNSFATYDMNANKINDPWPTAFASSGFDLDAVGVINQGATSIDEANASIAKLNVFPNPLKDEAVIQYCLNNNSNVIITIADVAGKNVYVDQKNNQSKGLQKITISDLNLNNGIYFLKLESNTAIVVQKIIISQ